MKTLTSIAMTALMVAATTVTADPMRDGEPVLTGKIDRFDCEQTLRALTEPEGLSDDLKYEYADAGLGYELLATKATYVPPEETCYIEWYRQTDVYDAWLHLKEVNPEADLPQEGPLEEKGIKKVRAEIKRYIQDSPKDAVLKPVLEHTNNVEVRVTTMFKGFEANKSAGMTFTKYNSKDF